ncbi:MAG TPA: isocitrate/isopropylmalate dehydrogenase family protein [Thermoanaerobaculia bacterium]|nr:isocitrate/isopropylmalate dehydrogenase family protein [Thermoanaerobaculia bacterium]
MTPLRIAVLPGDGIGPEVMSACLELLEVVNDLAGGLGLIYETVEAGAGCYRRTGQAIPEASLRKATEADAILLAAMGDPSVRYPDGTEIAPQIDLREKLQLFAGVRPIRSLPGIPAVLADPRASGIDFVIVRESTEGLFAARGKSIVSGDESVSDTMIITRAVSERLFDFAFELAGRRKARGFPGRVICVDKSNVLGSFAFFRRIFRERSERHPGIEAECAYVDAVGLNLVKRPWDYDVLVTENMFGDILSDVGAAIIGGMGLAPSADLGEHHAVFQPCHGSAPDIAGRGLANPTAMFLSAAMMLEWIGERHGRKQCLVASTMVTRAVEEAFRSGCLPCEMGGSDGTREVLDAVRSALFATTESGLTAR